MIDHEAIQQVMGQVLGIDPQAIYPDASMDNLSAWDSLSHMNLILALEAAFNVSFTDEEAANATSYELLTLIIDEHL